jgi:hypothetical protein
LHFLLHLPKATRARTNSIGRTHAGLHNATEQQPWAYLPNLDVLVPDSLLEDVARGVPLGLEAELDRGPMVHGRPRERAPSNLYPGVSLDAGDWGAGR